MSVVSFYPAHQAITPGAASPSPARDSETGLLQYTLDQLIAIGTGRPYIDNVSTNYSSILSQELGTNGISTKSPFTNDTAKVPWTTLPNVAVVGAGMGGLLTALQLGKLGMQVTVYEAGNAPLVSGVYNGAGRIAPAKIDDDNYTGYGELGAMRFPTNSYLFWHYMKATGMAAGSRILTAFPNPIFTPSLFTSVTSAGVGTISGLWKDQYSTTDPKNNDGLPSGLGTLQQKHLNAIFAYKPPGSTALSPSLIDIATFLAASSRTSAQTDACTTFWNATRTALYSTSYRAFLESRTKTDGSKLFTPDEITEIGYLGIGTGGFGPLYSRCVLEIMRLFMWSYATEVQVPDQRMYPEKLRAAIAVIPGAPVSFLYNTPVDAVAYAANARKWYVQTVDNFGTKWLANYDFLVLAMTSPAAKNLLMNSEQRLPRTTTALGNSAYYPFYDTARPNANLSSKIRQDLDNQNGMDSIKIFQTIYGPATGTSTKTANNIGNWQFVANPNTLTYDQRIRVAYGQFNQNATDQRDFGTTFTLPMKDTTITSAQTFATNKTVLALHYSWGAPPSSAAEWPNDLVDLSTNLFTGTDLASINTTGKFSSMVSQTGGDNLRVKLWRAMKARFTNYTTKTNLNPNQTRPVEENWANFFTTNSVVGGTEPDSGWNLNRSVSIVQWSKVPYIWMGFKLDRPGYGAYYTAAHRISAWSNASSLTTGAWDLYASGVQYAHPSVKRLYFSGDAASNYGGWVEGAFQGALATSASLLTFACATQLGFISLANRDKVNWTSVDALSKNAYAPTDTI